MQTNSVERRRSERSPLGLPLAVRGTSLDTRPFEEETVTLSVSAHGALVELVTKVTLGQTLFLRNPQTRSEAEASVTRLGSPRGTWTQVGVEFMRPDEEFWSAEGVTKAPSKGTERWMHPDDSAAAERGSSDGGREALQVETSAPHPDAASGPTLSEILMRALEQTLQQAAEKVVEAAAAARLTTTVNQAAEAIENFSHSRVRQIEERLGQYRQELLTSVREEVLSQIKADVAQAEDQLRNRAAELLEEARGIHSDFAERLRETGNQAAAQFSEEAAASSAQHLAKLTEQVQISIGEARSQIDAAAAALAESQENVKAETARAVSEAQKEAESVIAQSKQVYAEWETRLQGFREELSRSAEAESARFREHLQNVLAQLLSSLRL